MVIRHYLHSIQPYGSTEPVSYTHLEEAKKGKAKAFKGEMRILRPGTKNEWNWVRTNVVLNLYEPETVSYTHLCIGASGKKMLLQTPVVLHLPDAPMQSLTADTAGYLSFEKADKDNRCV